MKKTRLHSRSEWGKTKTKNSASKLAKILFFSADPSMLGHPCSSGQSEIKFPFHLPLIL